jgi:hypothetical protein
MGFREDCKSCIVRDIGLGEEKTRGGKAERSRQLCSERDDQQTSFAVRTWLLPRLSQVQGWECRAERVHGLEEDDDSTGRLGRAPEENDDWGKLR